MGRGARFAMKTELKRILLSRSFALEIVVFLFCYGGYALPTFFREWLSPWSESPTNRENALFLTLGGIFFGGVMLLLPFCSSICCASEQVKDIRGGMLPYYAIRGSARQYTVVKLFVAFLSSALAAGISFSMHAIFWNCIAEPFIYTAGESPFWEGTLFHTWAIADQSFLIYVEIAFGLAFSAGVWAVVAMAVAMWLPDKLLSVTVPACLCKVWSISTIQIGSLTLPGPETLYNDAQTIEGDLLCLGLYACLLYVAIFSYHIRLKRRICYA